MPTVLIATPLEPELVERIAEVDARVDVLFEPELLPPTRYPGDHRGIEGFRRSPDDEARFRALIERADVLFGLPGDSAGGLGGIGREVERLARAFAMDVIGFRRRDGGRARLYELLPQADAVCVTLPLTDETRGLLGRDALGLMKPGAIFVNVGRGGVVDEDALAEALADGRLAGAAL